MNLIPVSTSDYRRLAKKRLPRNLFDYIDGGSYNETTLAANVQDFEKLRMKQSVLRDVENIDTTAQCLGETFSMPLGLAPIGLAGMMSRRAEVQAVKAAEKSGIPFCLSTVSICSLEEVAKAATKPFWFQLYMMRDRSYVKELLARAKAAGCKTLVFTVDLTVVGARYRDARNGMAGRLSTFAKFRAALEYPTHPKWLLDVAIKGKPHLFGNLEKLVPSARSLADFKDWVDSQFDPTCTWKDIEWLRSIWDGDLIIKGVLSPEDAKEAVASGADAIVVSNHGGRQLDGVSSSINMTPRIRDVVGDKTMIIMDGGVRSGQDIVKAVANGADFTLIGRAWIWALAARGQDGLEALLATFKSEMDVSMALTGVTNIANITSGVLDQY
ncbi:MAG: L-lactate dehydrogenase [Robiginitomaculum sp.]|nr:L-lactate dehydrogenase [Robiginitomaculum sp.]